MRTMSCRMALALAAVPMIGVGLAQTAWASPPPPPAPTPGNGSASAPTPPPKYDQIPEEGTGDYQRFACHVDIGAPGYFGAATSLVVVVTAGNPGDADPIARDKVPLDQFPSAWIIDSQCVPWNPGS